jgi:hypothetical protein
LYKDAQTSDRFLMNFMLRLWNFLYLQSLKNEK